MRIRALLIGLTTATSIDALGCAPGHPASTPAPGHARPTGAAAVAAAALPSRYIAGHFVYDITSTGTVSSPTDTGAHPDTVTMRSLVSYDARQAAGRLQLNGFVQFRVAATGGVRTSNGPASATVDSVRLNASIDTMTSAVHLPTDNAAVPSCPVGGPIVEQARALAVERPRSIEPGAAWVDTVVRVSCLGGVPLTTRTARQFTVASELATTPGSGVPAILVSYHSDPRMEGEARRGASLLTLHGKGEGHTDQYYDRATGVLQLAHTVTTLDLDFAVNGRPQHLHQAADWQARLVKYATAAE
jgi:hypothetical protein